MRFPDQARRDTISEVVVSQVVDKKIEVPFQGIQQSRQTDRHYLRAADDFCTVLVYNSSTVLAQSQSKGRYKPLDFLLKQLSFQSRLPSNIQNTAISTQDLSSIAAIQPSSYIYRSDFCHNFSAIAHPNKSSLLSLLFPHQEHPTIQLSFGEDLMSLTLFAVPGYFLHSKAPKTEASAGELDYFWPALVNRLMGISGGYPSPEAKLYIQTPHPSSAIF